MFYPRLELTIPHYRALTELKKKYVSAVSGAVNYSQACSPFSTAETSRSTIGILLPYLRTSYIS